MSKTKWLETPRSSVVNLSHRYNNDNLGQASSRLSTGSPGPLPR